MPVTGNSVLPPRRKVRCPKCTALLTEPPTPIYECPICSTLLLAKSTSLRTDNGNDRNAKKLEMASLVHETAHKDSEINKGVSDTNYLPTTPLGRKLIPKMKVLSVGIPDFPPQRRRSRSSLGSAESCDFPTRFSQAGLSSSDASDFDIDTPPSIPSITSSASKKSSANGVNNKSEVSERPHFAEELSSVPSVNVKEDEEDTLLQGDALSRSEASVEDEKHTQADLKTLQFSVLPGRNYSRNLVGDIDRAKTGISIPDMQDSADRASVKNHKFSYKSSPGELKKPTKDIALETHDTCFHDGMEGDIWKDPLLPQDTKDCDKTGLSEKRSDEEVLSEKSFEEDYAKATDMDVDFIDENKVINSDVLYDSGLKLPSSSAPSKSIAMQGLLQEGGFQTTAYTLPHHETSATFHDDTGFARDVKCLDLAIAAGKLKNAHDMHSETGSVHDKEEDLGAVQLLPTGEDDHEKFCDVGQDTPLDDSTRKDDTHSVQSISLELFVHASNVTKLDGRLGAEKTQSTSNAVVISRGVDEIPSHLFSNQQLHPSDVMKPMSDNHIISSSTQTQGCCQYPEHCTSLSCLACATSPHYMQSPKVHLLSSAHRPILDGRLGEEKTQSASNAVVISREVDEIPSHFFSNQQLHPSDVMKPMSDNHIIVSSTQTQGCCQYPEHCTSLSCSACATSPHCMQSPKVHLLSSAHHPIDYCSQVPADSLSHIYASHCQAEPFQENHTKLFTCYQQSSRKWKCYPPLPCRGAAPLILCQECKLLLQMPSYRLPPAGHVQKLKCGSCRKISKFSFLNQCNECQVSKHTLASDRGMTTLHFTPLYELHTMAASSDLKCERVSKHTQRSKHGTQMFIDGNLCVHAGGGRHGHGHHMAEQNYVEGDKFINIGSHREGYLLPSLPVRNARDADMVQRGMGSSIHGKGHDRGAQESYDHIYRVTDNIDLRESVFDVMGGDIPTHNNGSPKKQFISPEFSRSSSHNSASQLPTVPTMPSSPLVEDHHPRRLSQGSLDWLPAQGSPLHDHYKYDGCLDLAFDTMQEDCKLQEASKGPKGYAGLFRRGLRELRKGSHQNKVMINDHLISDVAVKRAQFQAGPVHPGHYWYDYQAGFWGVMGGPCLGIIPPFIEEFNLPLFRDYAGGRTGVLVNGRELHKKDLEVLARRGLPTKTGKAYVVSITGQVIDEETGEQLKSLGKLAPSVERTGRGNGMFQPSMLQ